MEAKNMFMTLSNRGNPDHNENPEKPVFGCPNDYGVEVENFEEASKLARAYIEENMLGGGNWTGGKITNESGEQIGQVAYNGRVFKNYKSSEILHEAGRPEDRQRGC